jgi:hypothetical protein
MALFDVISPTMKFMINHESTRKRDRKPVLPV